MAEPLDPQGAANVFTAQIMALIGLANALVETGAVKSDALIDSLERQMDKLREAGVDASMALPLASVIRALRHEASQVKH
jgi:uncharacterized membrane protein YebE (DUF533 family)